MISRILLKLAILYWQGLLQFGNTILGSPNIIWRYNIGNFNYILATRYWEIVLQFGDIIIEVLYNLAK